MCEGDCEPVLPGEMDPANHSALVKSRAKSQPMAAFDRNT